MTRILVWSPNYAPELTGIPPLVTDACEWLAGRGHAVEVVTAFPNYPQRRIQPEYQRTVFRTERRGAVLVHRSWLRVRPRERFVDKALYELTFTAFSTPVAMKRVRRSDVLLCVVPSLGAAAVSAAIGRATRGRIPVVLWLQDLVLRAAASIDDLGTFARSIVRATMRLEAGVFRSAQQLVVCSPAFHDYVAGLGVDSQRVETIHNWVDLDRIAVRPPPPTASPLCVLYAGNLGYTQGFETLVGAADVMGDGLEVRIVGDGNLATHVRALAESRPNVHISGPVPDDAYPGLLASAHVHVLLQRGVSANANFPSKIATYLASGRPVVASISPSSSAASMLAESGAALVVPPEDPNALAGAFRQLADRPALRVELGARARTFAEEHFARDVALRRLEAILSGFPRAPTGVSS